MLNLVLTGQLLATLSIAVRIGQAQHIFLLTQSVVNLFYLVDFYFQGINNGFMSETPGFDPSETVEAEKYLAPESAIDQMLWDKTPEETLFAFGFKKEGMTPEIARRTEDSFDVVTGLIPTATQRLPEGGRKEFLDELKLRERLGAIYMDEKRSQELVDRFTDSQTQSGMRELEDRLRSTPKESRMRSELITLKGLKIIEKSLIEKGLVQQAADGV